MADDAALAPRPGVVADEGGAVVVAVALAADALRHRQRLVADDEPRAGGKLLRAQVAHLPVAVVDDDLVGAGGQRPDDRRVRLPGHERAAPVVVGAVDSGSEAHLVGVRHAGEALHVDAEVDPHRLSDTVRASRGCRWSWPSPRRSAPRHGGDGRAAPSSSTARRRAAGGRSGHRGRARRPGSRPARRRARARAGGPRQSPAALPYSRPMRIPARPASGWTAPAIAHVSRRESQVKTTAEPMTAKTSVSSKQRAADDRGPGRHVRVLGHRSLVRRQLGQRAGTEPDGERIAVDAHLDVVVERHDHQPLPAASLSVVRSARARSLGVVSRTSTAWSPAAVRASASRRAERPTGRLAWVASGLGSIELDGISRRVPRESGPGRRCSRW